MGWCDPRTWFAGAIDTCTLFRRDLATKMNAADLRLRPWMQHWWCSESNHQYISQSRSRIFPRAFTSAFSTTVGARITCSGSARICSFGSPSKPKGRRRELRLRPDPLKQRCGTLPGRIVRSQLGVDVALEQLLRLLQIALLIDVGIGALKKNFRVAGRQMRRLVENRVAFVKPAALREEHRKIHRTAGLAGSEFKGVAQMLFGGVVVLPLFFNLSQ